MLCYINFQIFLKVGVIICHYIVLLASSAKLLDQRLHRGFIKVKLDLNCTLFALIPVHTGCWD